MRKTSPVYYLDCGEVKELKMPYVWYDTREEAELALRVKRKARIEALKKELEELEREED